METARYAVAVLLVITLPPALGWWFVVHPFVDFWRKVGMSITYVMMTVLYVAVVVALLQIRDALVLTDLGTNWITVGVGGTLVFPAIWIAVRRAKQLTFAILVGVPELEADGQGGKLLNEGIYSVIRNPRYVEIVIGVWAYALFANYVGGYVIALLTVPGVHAIVWFEERELSRRFGAEYEAYCASVPRYIPMRRT